MNPFERQLAQEEGIMMEVEDSAGMQGSDTDTVWVPLPTGITEICDS